MPVLITYLLKLSISLGVVFLFYQFVLRKHTFYNWNRWYLLGYSLLSFVIPFINITPVLEHNRLTTNKMIELIPSVEIYTGRMMYAGDCPQPVFTSGWDKWQWTLFILGCGVVLLLLRLFIRFLSFARMRRQAQLISDNGTKLYRIDRDIIPFSFGNSIFINPQLHREEELQEIIRHEFVHVRQGHTHDIIWSELLCILNWYNPFAWLIRRAIRQNLEFIADRQVLQSGLDRKQYQYLLLKVIGNHHFSIANQFNFSSLKKRIAMMNKMKSARVHLLRFLFLLPLAAVFLLAFRNHVDPGGPQGADKKATIVEDRDTATGPGIDTIFWRGQDRVVIGNLSALEEPDVYGHKYLLLHNGREVPSFNGIDKSTVTSLKMLFAKEAKKKYGDSGKYGVVELYTHGMGMDTLPGAYTNYTRYFLTIADKNGNCTVIIKDRNKKEVERVPLTKWNENKSYYENKYGIIPPPPPPVEPPPPPPPPAVSGLPAHIRSIQVDDDHAVVILKNGAKEEYNLGDPKEKEAFQKKYGKKLPPPPPPPVPQTVTVIADSITWTSKDRVLRFTGKALLEDRNEVNIKASMVNIDMNNALVMINGREVDQNKDYINNKGGTYKVVSLTSEEAIKKYGEKGRSGAVEINEYHRL